MRRSAAKKNEMKNLKMKLIETQQELMKEKEKTVQLESNLALLQQALEQLRAESAIDNANSSELVMYDGESKDGKRYGKLLVLHGRYKGEMDNNGLRCGQGEFRWVNGDRYEGTWENNKMNGYGTYWWANGDR